MSTDDGYLLDNQQPEAGERFNSLSALFDPITFGHLARTGVSSGWHCWEIGAGSPSVPSWMAAAVGATGRVLATDIDTAWMPDHPGFEVRRHDVGKDPLPDGAFDLIHARLVLVHVPERERALEQICTALRPGGWLVLEEADPALQPLMCPAGSTTAELLANRIKHGFRQLMLARGVDLAYGRRLPGLLRGLGLTGVEADCFFPIASPLCTALEISTVHQIKDRLLGAGICTPADIEQHLHNVRAGNMDAATAPLVSAWGRNPV